LDFLFKGLRNKIFRRIDRLFYLFWKIDNIKIDNIIYKQIKTPFIKFCMHKENETYVRHSNAIKCCLLWRNYLSHIVKTVSFNNCVFNDDITLFMIILEINEVFRRLQK